MASVRAVREHQVGMGSPYLAGSRLAFRTRPIRERMMPRKVRVAAFVLPTHLATVFRDIADTLDWAHKATKQAHTVAIATEYFDVVTAAMASAKTGEVEGY